jgi:hypothetical protein
LQFLLPSTEVRIPCRPYPRRCQAGACWIHNDHCLASRACVADRGPPDRAVPAVGSTCAPSQETQARSISLPNGADQPNYDRRTCSYERRQTAGCAGRQDMRGRLPLRAYLGDRNDRDAVRRKPLLLDQRPLASRSVTSWSAPHAWQPQQQSLRTRRTWGAQLMEQRASILQDR